MRKVFASAARSFGLPGPDREQNTNGTKRPAKPFTAAIARSPY
jgi:hypothetical protein